MLIPMGRGALLILLLAAPAAAGDQIPLPVKRSTILRKCGVTYFVEGRRKIPRGCEISIQKDVYIVGRGTDAVLEVEGSLQIHGVRTREVIISNLWIEPSRRSEDIHLDMVIFRGGGGLRATRQVATKGKIFVENVIFQRGTKLEIHMAAGRIDLSSTACQEPARIVGLVEEGKRFSALTVNIRGCFNPMQPNGFLGGLTVIGARDATIRLNHMAGAKSLFRDNVKLTFDGNKVQSHELIFRQSRSGRFSKTKLQKCDIYSTKVRFRAPAGKPEIVYVDKCWFAGLTKKKEIRASVLKEENNVRVKFGKINKRALELAGPLER